MFIIDLENDIHIYFVYVYTKSCCGDVAHYWIKLIISFNNHSFNGIHRGL